LSNRTLSEIETQVLNKGLKYGIKNKRINKFEIITRFEMLAQSINKFPLKPDESNLNCKNTFFKNLNSYAFEFIEICQTTQDNLTKEEHAALSKLAKDESIVITKADKGNAVVIQNKKDYLEKVQKLIDIDSKSSKFKKLKQDVTVTRERNLANKLRELRKNGEINEEVYKQLSPKGSKAGVLYGLPKIHKDGAPIRPIISAVGTYNYKLAKYLDSIIKPLRSTNDFMLKDTFDFVNRVSKINTNEGDSIVSFDVESLFTNIPVNETINIILKRAFQGRTTKFHGLRRKTLKELLLICVTQSHFVFNGSFYDQIDGVSMGSPLGPTFADFFMDDFENEHFEDMKRLGVILWLRYVDDTFVILRNKDDLKNLKNFLNNQHENINFTVECETEDGIPFLDTRVKRTSDSRLKTILYHKKTFTGT
jgi:ribosomal protein L19E